MYFVVMKYDEIIFSSDYAELCNWTLLLQLGQSIVYSRFMPYLFCISYCNKRHYFAAVILFICAFKPQTFPQQK